MKNALTVSPSFKPRPNQLEGKNIIVTGANRGIGESVSLSLAKFGATVILLGKNLEALEVVYDRIEKIGGATPAIYPVDLKTFSDAEGKKMRETLESEFGEIHGIIHNAAILGKKSPIASYSEADWNSVLNTNLTAPFLLTKALIPLMLKSKAANVLFTLDDSAFGGKAFWGAYAVAKAGLKNLCEVLADEYEKNASISFNTYHPKATRTDLRQSAFPAEDPSKLKTPEALEKDYVFLMSDHQTKISGEHFIYQPVK